MTNAEYLDRVLAEVRATSPYDCCVTINNLSLIYDEFGVQRPRTKSLRALADRMTSSSKETEETTATKVGTSI